MARPARKHPTEGELEILRVVWEIGPTEIGAIRDALRARRDVATTTVATMLGIMLEKGYVRRRRGPHGYRWEARLTREKARTGMMRDFVDRLFDGSAAHAISHMLRNTKISAQEFAELQRLMREWSRREGRKGDP